MKKPYVCQLCLGSGEESLHCQDQACPNDHQNEGCVEGRAGPCHLCVVKGLPSTVWVEYKPDATIDAKKVECEVAPSYDAPPPLPPGGG